MTKAYLYMWTQKSTGMWYVGSRSRISCHPDDGYVCSSPSVRKMIKDNPNDWEREIICIGDPKYILDLETSYLKSMDARRDPMSFNKHNNDGIKPMSGMVRMFNGEINAFVEPGKVDEFLSAGWKKGHSETAREKMKLNHRDVSGENNPCYGKVGNLHPKHGIGPTEFNKERVKAALTGVPKSAEHKANMSLAKQGENNPMFGRKHSKEANLKRSQSLKGRIPWNKGIRKSDIQEGWDSNVPTV